MASDRSQDQTWPVRAEGCCCAAGGGAADGTPGLVLALERYLMCCQSSTQLGSGEGSRSPQRTKENGSHGGSAAAGEVHGVLAAAALMLFLWDPPAFP